MEHCLQRSNETLNILATDYLYTCMRMFILTHDETVAFAVATGLGYMVEITCGAMQRGRPPTYQLVKNIKASRMNLV